MTFDAKAWLEEPLTEGSYAGKPRHEYLCFLIAANGFSTEVYGWGTLSTYRSGHQCGLEQEDALALLQYNSFINGLFAAGIDIAADLKPHLENYIKNYERLHEQQQAANEPNEQPATDVPNEPPPAG